LNTHFSTHFPPRKTHPYSGGIIDDTIITNAKDFLYVVVNAGCFDKDMIHIKSQLDQFQKKGKDVNVQVWENRSLLALQGPTAEKALQLITVSDLSSLRFFQGRFADVGGAHCYIQRSGYTGEDGFELSVPTEAADKIARALLADPDVKPCGLGARDTLRLEAGLCLYGHDLDEQTTPKQANLLWTISKRRIEEGGFIGSDVILGEIPGKIQDLPKRRIGLFAETPAREGTTIHDPSNLQQIGVVTSGTYSPVLKKSIAMAYVKPPFHKLDGKLRFCVRGKYRDAVVTKLPFIETHYKY